MAPEDRLVENLSEFSNIPLKHTPDPQSTVYGSEFLSFGVVLGDADKGICDPGVCWCSLIEKKHIIFIPEDPWDWYIYTYILLISMGSM